MDSLTNMMRCIDLLMSPLFGTSASVETLDPLSIVLISCPIPSSPGFS